MSKKAILVTIISIVYGLSAKAQKTDTVVYYMKTPSEANQSEFPVTLKDSADFYRVILPPDTSTDRDLFPVMDYYKNGKIKMTGKSANQKYFLRLEGVCMQFFLNGRRKSVKNYSDGGLLGDMTLYFPNGRLYLDGSYSKDGKLNVNTCIDSTGTILAEGGNGRYVKYDKNFKRVVAEGNIKNGLEDGEWHGQPDDSIRYVCIYDKGTVKSGTGYDSKGREHLFTSLEVNPMYKGGMDGWYLLLSKNVHYPAVAKERNIQGTVVVTFSISKYGVLSDIKVLSGVGGGCDEEAVRAIKLSRPWVSGYRYGMPVRVQYTVPIKFSLSSNN
jgi:TonB family protein